MAIIIFAAAAAAALGGWNVYRLWRALPRRNSDLVLF
jgi:hypothetical protein